MNAFLSTVLVLATAAMSFLEHLDELRRRIIASLIALGLALPLCFAISDRIFDFLMGPLRAALPPGAELIATTVAEVFLFHVKMSFFAALILSAPVILIQAWLFISPGLYDRCRDNSNG